MPCILCHTQVVLHAADANLSRVFHTCIIGFKPTFQLLLHYLFFPCTRGSF